MLANIHDAQYTTILIDFTFRIARQFQHVRLDESGSDPNIRNSGRDYPGSTQALGRNIFCRLESEESNLRGIGRYLLFVCAFERRTAGILQNPSLKIHTKCISILLRHTSGSVLSPERVAILGGFL